MATLNFNATNVAQSTTPPPIPAGWYNAMITESEIKPTNAGTGSYLSLQFKIIDGEFAGRVVFTILNLDNPNPVAVEIAYANLSAICHSVGQIEVQDSQQLHGKPLSIKLNITPGTNEYPDPKNEIKGYGVANSAGNATNPAASISNPAATQTADPAWAAKPAATQPVTQQAVAQEQVVTQQAAVQETVAAQTEQVAQTQTAEAQTTPAATQTAAAGKPPWAQ